jgi:predicted ferric reductase
MELIIRGALWFGFYLFLVLFPLVIGAVFHPAGGRSFSLELGVACGYVGLAIMAFEFALISRVKSVSGAFGRMRWSSFIDRWDALRSCSCSPIRFCFF